MFEPRGQCQGLAIAAASGDGVLRHHACFVLNFNGQVERGQHIACDAQDAGELAGFQAVVYIAVDPGLQLAALLAALCSAAVEKVFGDVAHFGDVKVRGYRFTIGQHDAQGLVWVGF